MTLPAEPPRTQGHNTDHPVRLVICRGLPGSGKTTYALKAVAERLSGDLVRINRDGFRRMLFGPDYRIPEPAREEAVTAAERGAISGLLSRGVSVICDDTNLRAEHVTALWDIGYAYGAEVEILDEFLRVPDEFLRVPDEVCVDRDALRPEGERVGADVITRMWRAFLDREAVR